jgi:hypothetical protein
MVYPPDNLPPTVSWDRIGRHVRQANQKLAFRTWRTIGTSKGAVLKGESFFIFTGLLQNGHWAYILGFPNAIDRVWGPFKEISCFDFLEEST